MQRRAVAVYVALFVLVGTATGALIATADSPEVAFENPDYQLTEGETFEYEGQEYTVTSIDQEEEEDGATTWSGEVTWEEITDQSEDWDAESVVTLDETEWLVVIEDEDTDRFTLREQIDRQAILEADDDADNETVERDGEEYVVITEDGESRLVPADEYFPAPEEREFVEGDTFEYDGHEATVQEVTAEEAIIAWTGPETFTDDLDQEGSVTLGGTEFVTFFPGDDTVVLTSDVDDYEAQLAGIDQFESTLDGLWRVLAVSLFSALMVAGLAFVPSRY